MINLQKYWDIIEFALKQESDKLKAGFTIGDMNGVGTEILLSALSNKKSLDLFTPIIYGPLENLKQAAVHLNENLPFLKISHCNEAKDGQVNVVDNFKEYPKISFGKLDKKMGQLAFKSIEMAVRDLNEKQIDVLVTPPINKEAIHSDKFDFMGHTDYLDSKISGKAIMMMVSDQLKVALLTEHISIADVASTITSELIYEKIINMNHTLMRDFQIEKPKIAVLSIDPHAGDNGVISSIDKKIVTPTINTIKSEGLLVYGPFAADSFFGSLEYKNYDLVVAAYHDQGLIPFKTLSFGSGVNYTSGLDRIRTSPDHGTGFSIAGKGIALDDSFVSSINLAIDIFRKRKIHDEFSKDKFLR